MSKHTPSPWKAEGWENIVVNSVNGNTLVACPGDGPNTPLEEIKANARLIAAAPELLEALRAMRLSFKDLPREYIENWKDRVGAIHKAEVAIHKAETGV
jgi:hypothetical protein